MPLDAKAWAGPWDCAEFVSWCVYQTTGQLRGLLDPSAPLERADPFSGGWARDASATVMVGASTYPSQHIGPLRVSPSIAVQTPGAILIRTPQPGADGHVAISAGNGDTIEAYSTKRGVIAGRSLGRRWDWGLLVGGLVFECRVAPLYLPPTVLRAGSRGETVRRVQAQLSALGFPCTADGDFGRQTSSAVAAFQRARHLVPDGEVGPLTLAELGLSQS